MSLDAQRAAAAARHGAAAAGVDPDQLRLIRAGSAVVYGCGEVIIRVTGPQTPAREVATHLEVAALLNSNDIRAAEPALPAPVEATGCRATVWKRETELPDPVPPAWVGETAAAMHALAAPRWLAPLDVLGITRRRVRMLSADQSLPLEVRTLLSQGLMNATALVERLLDGSARQVVHGDLPGNVLVTPRGCVLIDFENTGAGDPTWDIVRLAHGPARFAGRSPEQLRECLRAYRSAGGELDLDRVRELMSVVDVIGASWALAARRASSAMAAEAKVRLAWVKDPETAPRCTAV